MKPLRVVTEKRWLREQFAGGSGGTVFDWGWEVDPSSTRDWCWWAGTGWVARALAAGADFSFLTSCGERWVAELPWEWRQRPVVLVTAGSLREGLPPELAGLDRVHAKTPGAKAGFEAQTFGTAALAQTLEQFALPDGLVLQLSGLLGFREEVRFFCADGRVVAQSLYRAGGDWWGSEGFAERAARRGPQKSLALAREFADALLREVPTARGCTVDVGVCRDGTVAVVEDNAAWSSGPYDCDPAGVESAVRASHDFAGAPGSAPEWGWRPSAAYGAVRPLPLAPPARRALRSDEQRGRDV